MILSLMVATLANAAEVTWVGGGHASNPQWSNDGTWLAFEVNNNSDKVDLYVVKVGANATPAQPQKVGIPGASSSFSGGGGYAANPVWHPRGAMIFEAANAGGTPRLYYVTPGAGMAAEYLNAGQAAGSLQWPAISADGAQLAFTSSATGKGDVYIFSQQANKVALTVTTDAPESAPRFAADGKTLVYSRKNQGTEDVYAWSAGAQARLVAGGGGDQTRPRVVGDKVVYFTNERGDEHWDIAVVPLAGGDRRIVAKDVRLPQHSAPAVTPDGSAVLYGSSAPTQDGSVFVTRLDGGGGSQVTTGGLTAVGDPTVVTGAGRTLLAFTALPKVESDWRQLHVIDVTGKF